MPIKRQKRTLKYYQCYRYFVLQLITKPQIYPEKTVKKLRLHEKNCTWISSILIIFAFASSTFAAVGTLPLVTDPPPGVNANDSDYKAGYLNVTKAPYNADPTGATDATQDIQNAIDDARDYNLACFFPSGTYLISDTIEGRQTGSYNNKNKWIPERTKPCVLIGSKIGPRPVLKLNNYANGFTSGSWKAAVIMWTQSGSSLDPNTNDSNSNFNQVFSGIDIDLGTGNKKAVGIWFTASQGSCLENVKVYSEDDKFHIGFYSSPGQGGGAYNLEVIGGDYGYYGIVDTRYPMLAGCTFQDQAIAPVYYEGKQPLVLVGCDFVNTANTPIVMQNEGNQRLSFIDCVVEIPGTFVENTNDLNLYMENVYLKGVTTIVKKGSGQWNTNDSSVWTRVNEYSFCKKKSYKTVIDGISDELEFQSKTEDVGEPAQELLRVHRWDDIDAPSFEDNDAVNVKTDLGSNNAKGDGSSDDTASLQYAIDNYDKVFLPKGIYRLTGSLVLHSNTQFFGVPTCITRIAPRASWNPSTNKPLIQTDNDADATTVLTGIFFDLHPDRPNFTPLLWSAGRKSVVSQVLISIEERANGQISANNHMLHIKNNGGGRWRTVCGAWQMLSNLTANANTRLLFIENTTEPLHMYAINTERTLSDVQAEILNSQNVSIYFYKSEAGSAAGGGDNKTTLRINGSDNVAVYSMAGPIEIDDANLPIIDIVDSNDIAITQAKTFKSYNDFPALTFKEKYFGSTTKLKSSKGLSLFRRGNPSRITDGVVSSAGGAPSEPAAPSSLAATSVSASEISLNWTINSDNEDKFIIQRKEGAGTFSRIGTVGAGVSSYSDTGLTNNTTYSYRVKAKNAQGNSGWCDECSATTSSPNLLLNPSFENCNTNDPCIDWNLNTATAARVTNSEANPDLDGLKHVSITPDSGFLRVQQWIPVTEGKNYTVTGNVRLTGDLQGGKGAYIQVKFYKNDQTTGVGKGINVSGLLYGTQDWTEYQKTGLTAGTEAAYLRIRLICDGANQNPNATAKFDKISIVEE